MLDQPEFDRRVKYNAELFNQQAEKNEFTPSLYYLFDQEPKQLSSINYGKMYHDIFAAAVCGTLVLSDLNEKDSIEMKRGKVTKVELKTSYLNTKNVYVNTRNNIYVGTRTPLDNYVSAQFHKGYYHEEDMPLYLVVCDATDKWNLDVVGAWQIDGKKVNGFLEESSRSITFSKFLKHGRRKNVKVHSIGYSAWVNTMKKRLPKRVTRRI
jgi:hypothetical protein